MAKIVYFATLPIVYNGGVTCNHKVGVFESEQDAVIASMIVKNILKHRKDMVEHTEFYSIARKKVDDENIKCYNNIEEFVSHNIHTQRYLSDRGQEALDDIINRTLDAENMLSR